MKRNNLFKFLSLAAIAGASSLLMISCEKDDDDDNPNQDRTYTVTGNASGSQVVPVVSTSASATLVGTYVSAINTLNYTITWTGLTGAATAIHLHGPASAGVEAGVIHTLNLSSNGVSGASNGTLILADSTEAHLLSGKLYYNIHTAVNPDGEIRGQVTATAN